MEKVMQKVTLERTLKFSPDIIFVGFCMNDVTEPFVVDREFGGTGLDYHRVMQSSNTIVGWFANETGFGQLEQALMARGKSREAEKRLEVYNVRKMAAESRTSAEFQKAWRTVLEQMTELYGIAAQHGVPVVLVIFPYTFQLGDRSLRTPQEILARHAQEHGVPVIDTTDDFAKVVFDDPELVAYLRSRGKTAEEISAYHAHIVERYFFDEDHFTEAGNRIVARRLFEYLSGAGIVRD